MTAQTRQQYDRSLARSLVPMADRLRQLSTDFGLRPYRVFRVVTEWTGDRGQGGEWVVSEQELLPTPKVESLEGLDTVLEQVGALEQGSLVVTEVSATFTEDELMGREVDGQPVPASRNYFWEIAYTHQSAAGGDRRRFTVQRAVYDPDNLQWKVYLHRAAGSRDRAGAAYG